MENWPVKKLGDVADFLDNQRKPVTARDRIPGPYPYYGANGKQDSVRNYIFDDELVLLAEDGGYFGSNTRPIAYRVSGKCWVNNHAHVLKNKEGISDIDFLGYSLMYYDVTPYITGTTRAKLNKSEAQKIPLQIPELSIQKKIVERLDAIRKAQELCDTQISKAEELFESLISKEIIKKTKNWPVKTLKEISLNLDSKRKPIEKSKRKKGIYPYYGASGIVDYVNNYIFDEDLLLVSEDGANLKARVTPIAFSLSGKTWVNNHAHVLKFPKIETQKFVEVYLNTVPLDFYITGTAQPKLNQDNLNKIPIPLPEIKEQQRIAEKLSAVQEHKKLLLKQKTLYKELFNSVLDKSMKGEMGD